MYQFLPLRSATLLALGFTALTFGSVSAELLTNGSFEDDSTYVDQRGGGMSLPIGSTTIPGWKVVNGSGTADLAWLKNPIAPDGNFILDLMGYNDSAPYAGISQTIATKIGTTYLLSFSTLADAAGPATVLVQAGSQSQTFTNSTSGSWLRSEYSFTATSASTTISITGQSGFAGYIGLDNVSLIDTTPNATLVNGSFEQGSFVDTDVHAPSLPLGSTKITGWKVVNAEIAWARNDNPYVSPAQKGDFHLDLTGFHDARPYGGVSQTIATTVGTSYKVSFYLGTYPSKSDYSGSVSVIVRAGSQSQPFTYDATGVTGPGVVWKPFSYVFTATTPATAISIIGIKSAGGHYLALDNVSVGVNATPPSAPVNLIANGDFEDSSPFIPTGEDTVSLPADSTLIPGWIVADAEVHWTGEANPFGFRAQNGMGSMDLTGYHDALPYGAIKQTVPTVVGHTYDVTFYLGYIPGNALFSGPVSAELKVGNSAQTFTTKSTGSGTTSVWTKCTRSFTAASTSTVVSIGGTQSTGGNYIGIDNVSMVDTSDALPQPTFANGGFEQGTFVDGGGAMVLPIGSTVLSGWTTINGNVTWESNTNSLGIKSKAGNFSLNLLGSPVVGLPGGVTQTVPTIPGQYYRLSFFLGGMPTGEHAGPVSIIIRALNSEVFHNFDATGFPGATTTVWDKQQVIFKAVEDATEISFIGNSTATGYIGLDAITFEAVKLQTISFPVAAKGTVGQTITLNAVASSGLPVTYEILSDSGNPNISPNARLSGNQLTFTGVGVVKVFARQAGNATYVETYAASSPQGTAVAKGTQTLTPWILIPNHTYGDAPFAIAIPTASSGLAVTVTSADTNVARFSGKSITLVGAGAVTLTATQPGNANYAMATSVSTSFVVAKATPLIVLQPVTSSKVGKTVALRATSNSRTTPILYRVISGPGSIEAGSNVLKFTGKGTIILEAYQNETANYKANTSNQVSTTGLL